MVLAAVGLAAVDVAGDELSSVDVVVDGVDSALSLASDPTGFSLLLRLSLMYQPDPLKTIPGN